METTPFHVGIVTGDLAASMDLLSAALGVTWTAPGSGGAVFTGTDGSRQPQPVSCISREGPIHVDLIQGEPGSIWAAAGKPRVHHFAYWTGDLAGDIQRLTAEGWRLELTLPDAEGAPTVFAYLIREDGFRLELIDEAGRDAYEKRLEREEEA
ncbi:MAG: VOC family protein [Streptosporangiales bacterium]|jgi:catechol 2,3-dioxygenase-like lactoylglutathione lyase family enzyme|nr:VOC family protein [Streptosporangiales bacterium]